jgi:hypothetical protein
MKNKLQKVYSIFNNILVYKNKTNSVALIRKQNYTDRATAACRRS